MGFNAWSCFVRSSGKSGISTTLTVPKPERHSVATPLNPGKLDKCVNEVIFCRKSAENYF